MDPISQILESDESESEALVLDTDYDISMVGNSPTSTPTVNRNNIASVWRDIVVEEQMEECLTRLEVTTKTGYADIDDPNQGYRDPYYSQMNCGKKRKRNFSLNKPDQKTVNITDAKCDLDVHPVVKKMCVNSDTKKSKSKRKRKKKKHVEKKDNNVSESSSYLSDIINVEEKSLNDFANDLCTNLCEYNKILMLSVISKIDRKIILEKYNKTCLIEASGGQMTKNGDRKRTAGGIFFNLIKEDKLIPNRAKKDLFGFTQNKCFKNKIKQEKRKKKKEQLMKIIAHDKKEAEKVKMLHEELETQPSVCAVENKEPSIN